jgi:hypothetical protein
MLAFQSFGCTMPAHQHDLDDLERGPGPGGLQVAVLHPHRFGSAADTAARTLAAAAVRLAAIKRERRP